MICCENIWVLYMSESEEVKEAEGLEEAINENSMANLDHAYISDVVPGDDDEVYNDDFEDEVEDEVEDYEDDFEDDFPPTPRPPPPSPPVIKKVNKVSPPNYIIPTASTTAKKNYKRRERNEIPFKGGKTRRQKKKSVRKMESVVFSFLHRTSRKKCRRNRKTRKARKIKLQNKI